MEQQQTTHSVTILFTNHYSHILCKFVTSNSFWFDHLSLPPFPKASLPLRSTLRTAPLVTDLSASRSLFTNFATTHISSRHSRQLRVRVICRGDFHDISRDDVETVQTPQDSAQLAGRPASSLRRACGWSESWVDRIDLRVLRKLLPPFIH